MVWRYDRYLNQEYQSGLNHPQSLHVVQVSYPLHTQNAHNSGHVRRVSLGFPWQRPWWMPSLMYTWTLPRTRWHLATRAAFVRNRGSSRLTWDIVCNPAASITATLVPINQCSSTHPNPQLHQLPQLSWGTTAILTCFDLLLPWKILRHDQGRSSLYVCIFVAKAGTVWQLFQLEYYIELYIYIHICVSVFVYPLSMSLSSPSRCCHVCRMCNRLNGSQTWSRQAAASPESFHGWPCSSADSLRKRVQTIHQN